MSKEDDTSKSVDKLRVYFKKHKADSYSITEHPLEQADEYLKGIYITMLCTIMCNNSEPREEQRFFIERLMKGIGATGTLNDYVKKALEIDDKFAEEFVRQFKDNELKYNFVVDALVLVSSVGSPNKKDVEFISEICDMLAISKDEVRFFSNMALGIVEQDSKKFVNSSDENLTLEKIDRFKYYYKDFFGGALIDNDEVVYFYTNEKKELDFKMFFGECETIKFNEKTIVFENYIINLNDIRFEFEDCYEVKFINCSFTGNKIIFRGCSEINISNCNFKDYNDGTFNLLECKTFRIENCTLYNCGRIDESDAYGGVIIANSVNNIIMDSCKFVKCFIKTNNRAYNYYARGAILFMQNNIRNIIIENNQFDCCKCDSASSEKQSLFFGDYSSEKFENNIITNADMNLKF